VAGIVYGHFSLAARLQRFDVLFTLINATANVLLCVALIPRSGLVGAAIASMVSYSISIPVQLVFPATRSYSLVLLREGARIAVVGLLTVIAFSLAARFAPAGLALAVASIVFVAAAIPARLIKKEDLRFVAGLVFP